jgi:hypothetical protein
LHSAQPTFQTSDLNYQLNFLNDKYFAIGAQLIRVGASSKLNIFGKVQAGLESQFER